MNKKETPLESFNRMKREAKVNKILSSTVLADSLPLSEVVSLLLWISKMFDLTEGIWYWKEDEDGDNPLSEQELIGAWRKR
jgi:hypothetical protein